MAKLTPPRRIRASRIRKTVTAGERRRWVCLVTGEGEARVAACMGTSAMPLVGDGSADGRDRVSGRGSEGVADEGTLSDGAGKKPGALSETTFAVEGAGKAPVV